jgi:pimeloyl-ACP methyl ester carboxylesterase
MVTISILHEALVAEGYSVLSFDRLGVGFSDPNVNNIVPSAEDVVNEMNFILNAVFPSAESPQWILIGPSMGSIVSQCYMAAYPERVRGFVNVDGLPYPFQRFESSFLKASTIYKLDAHLIWTGLFRPFIGPFLRTPSMQWLSSAAFPIEYAIAQMNQRDFYHNLALEMVTMMRCCDYSVPRWGRYNLLAMTQSEVEKISEAEPFENLEIDLSKAANDRRRLTTFRSESEVGLAELTSPEQLDNILAEVQARAVTSPAHATATTMAASPQDLEEGNVSAESPQAPDSSLQESLLSSNEARPGSKTEGVGVHTVQSERFLSLWRDRLVVRVLSGRNHDYGNAIINQFYTQEMKNLAGAEHVLHAHLSHNGRRRVYPHLNHMKMFAQTEEILLAVREVDEALAAEESGV